MGSGPLKLGVAPVTLGVCAEDVFGRGYLKVCEVVRHPKRRIGSHPRGAFRKVLNVRTS